jgi:GDP-L-fucose synthase
MPRLSIRNGDDVKKVLLTGSSGFVGRNLLEALCGKYSIDAPRRSELDLNDQYQVDSFLKGKKYECIILASNPSPLRSGDSTETMMLSMLTQYFSIVRRRESYDKLIYFGSGAEYDKSYDICQAREEEIGLKIPQSQYGLAKYIMNQHARNSDSIYNLRLFGCFGPYEYWPTCFISNAICRVLFQMPISIRQNVFFDYIYIDDVAKVVEWLIENNPSEKDYNLCSGHKIDLCSIANMVLEVSGAKSEIRVKREGLNLEYTGNCERLSGAFAGFSITPIKEGISKLYEWYESHMDTIDPNKILD